MENGGVAAAWRAGSHLTYTACTSWPSSEEDVPESSSRSIGIGPLSFGVWSSMVSKSRSKPSEAGWSAGGTPSNGRGGKVIASSRHCSRAGSGVPGVCSRTLGGLMPNALGKSRITFIPLSRSSRAFEGEARTRPKIFPSPSSRSTRCLSIGARVPARCWVPSPSGARVRRGGSSRTLAATRFSHSDAVACGAPGKVTVASRVRGKFFLEKGGIFSKSCPFEKNLRGQNPDQPMTCRHLEATFDSFRYFFRGQLTVAFPRTSTNQKPVEERFEEPKGRVGRIDAKKMKAKLKASHSNPPFNGPWVQRSTGLALSRARHAPARVAGWVGCGVKKSDPKLYYFGRFLPPCLRRRRAAQHPTRPSRDWLLRGSVERTNARYPSAHGSARRRRGPGARANPVAAVVRAPPRRRNR